MFGGRTEIGLALGVAECCTPAPPILEYDIEGNLINAWGGPVEEPRTSGLSQTTASKSLPTATSGLVATAVLILTCWFSHGTANTF